MGTAFLSILLLCLKFVSAFNEESHQKCIFFVGFHFCLVWWATSSQLPWTRTTKCQKSFSTAFLLRWVESFVFAIPLLGRHAESCVHRVVRQMIGCSTMILSSNISYKCDGVDGFGQIQPCFFISHCYMYVYSPYASYYAPIFLRNFGLLESLKTVKKVQFWPIIGVLGQYIVRKIKMNIYQRGITVSLLLTLRPQWYLTLPSMWNLWSLLVIGTETERLWVGTGTINVILTYLRCLWYCCVCKRWKSPFAIKNIGGVKWFKNEFCKEAVIHFIFQSHSLCDYWDLSSIIYPLWIGLHFKKTW